MPKIVTGQETIFDGKKKPSTQARRGFPGLKERANSVSGFAKDIAMRRMMKQYRGSHG